MAPLLTHGHHQMVNTKIRLIIFFAVKDREALYSQQKQDWELTVAQIMSSIAKFRLKLKKVGKTTRPFSSVQFSHLVVSDSLRPQESQHARPACSSPTPRVHSNTSIESVMPSSHLILCHPLLLLPPIPPSIRVFFQWVNSLHEVAKVLEFQL